jgi:hydroxymethylpyrimidine pyrophosphatase-like HAD family hydrolase
VVRVTLPRLVATDLDGTLLRTDGTVSDRTAAVLREVLDRDVAVAFVTARPRRWMDHLWAYVGSRGLAVVSNGALLLDVATGEPLEVRGLDREPGLVLAEEIRARVPGCSFAVEMLSGIALEPEYREPGHAPPGSPTGDLADVWLEPALKLLVRHEALPPDDFRAGVLAVVGESAVATWTMDGLMEISAVGVTKGAGLARLSALVGVEAPAVLAFGDMPNDLPMLAWAGTSYAVANAHPSVLAAADHVAPSNDDDGVATVLAGVFGL